MVKSFFNFSPSLLKLLAKVFEKNFSEFNNYYINKILKNANSNSFFENVEWGTFVFNKILANKI